MRPGARLGLALLVALPACEAADGGTTGRAGNRAAPDPFQALPVERRGAVRPFDLERLDGGRLTLAEYRGRMVLVNIWASWCGPCRAELPALDALVRDLGDSAPVFITLNEDVERDRAAAFVAELGFPYPVGLGEGRLRGRHYGFGLPFTMLVDAEGRAMYRWYGYGGEQQIQAIRRMVEAEIE
ncbi:MAG TPA: TlpA disulfide reductase family protein [Gemmatimonadales bacterium]|jgi:thiol-disulfide isomerase/thioredoxin